MVLGWGYSSAAQCLSGVGVLVQKEKSGAKDNMNIGCGSTLLIIPALRMLREEDHLEFKASLGYVGSSRIAGIA